MLESFAGNEERPNNLTVKPWKKAELKQKQRRKKSFQPTVSNPWCICEDFSSGIIINSLFSHKKSCK